MTLAFYERQVKHLEVRVEALLVIRKRICELMPPLRNVSLRDTLGSIGKISALYDIRFRAHEVPCDTQYQLSCPVDDSLMGIDYLEAWISELLKEAIWIAQFTSGSCISVLERFCSDYRGLHVNLSTFLNLAKIYWSASGGAMWGCSLNVQSIGASLDSGIRLALTPSQRLRQRPGWIERRMLPVFT